MCLRNINDMDILTKTISLIFKPRQQQIAKFAQEADIIQHKQLSHLLSRAKDTAWGLKYDYKSIHNYTTFSERVPLQIYDDVKPFVERMIQGERNLLWPSSVRWYAMSSGTTNDRSKFLPITSEVLHDCHYQGAFDTVSLYLRNHPDSHFFAHKGLILGGSLKPSAMNGHSFCGDLSAVLLQNINPLVNLIRVPSKQVILMNEWESKMKAIVSHTWNKDVGNLSGVPSWMLTLIKAILKHTGKDDLSEVWPNLEVFFHGGISFEPYREQYKSLISSDRMHYMETYNASEGFFGIQDDPEDKSLLLMQDYGTFYEFIPFSEIGNEHPTVLPLTEVSEGVNYAMIISTTGGLWRYQIGDTVRFTSLHPHKFIITGRTKHFINAFGEELMVDNAEKAISEVCSLTGSKIKEYTVAPLFKLNIAKGCHQWLIEFEKIPKSLPEFAELLDKELQRVNSDYEAKRYKEISLQPLEIVIAKKGLFYDWLKSKGKLGGQHKIPRLNNDRIIMNELLQLNQL